MKTKTWTGRLMAVALCLSSAYSFAAQGLPGSADVSSTLPDSPDRNQQDVGSCHSFAATGLVESALFRYYGLHIRLSEADMFVGRIVTDKSYYEDAAAAMRRVQGTGKDPKEVKVSEGGFPVADMGYVLQKGMATNFSADYADMMLRYRRMRDAEQRTMQGIARQNSDYAPGGNRFTRWYYNTFVPLFYDPGKHWAQLETEPQSRRITEMALLGGPQNTQRLAQERELVRKSLDGFKVVQQGFTMLDVESAAVTDADRCRKGGQKQKEWIARQLADGRPVAVMMQLGGLKAWGQDSKDSMHARHAFMITGYETSKEGVLTFSSRNSWGGDNPAVPESQLCRVYNASTMTAPNDPHGKIAKAPAGLIDLDVRNLPKK